MVILTHQTALELWRGNFLWERLLTRPCRNAINEGTNRLELDDVIDALRPMLISDDDDWPCESAPLHVLCSRGAARIWRLPHSKWHEWSHALPAGSLYRIVTPHRGLKGRPFLVTSPELTLLVMAKDLTFPEMVELEFELCGSYRISPSSPDGFRTHCEALTTPSSIQRFCSHAGTGVHGVKTVRLASEYVLEGAASPRESALAALLSIRRHYGGLGLPAPELNGRLDLDSDAKNICGKDHLLIDLLWREQGVGVEYDSDAFHMYVDPKKVESDKRRVNAALRMGVQLFSMTNAQLMDPYRFRSFAQTVAKALGVRLRPFTSRQLDRETELRSVLLGSRSL